MDADGPARRSAAGVRGRRAACRASDAPSPPQAGEGSILEACKANIAPPAVKGRENAWVGWI